MTEHRPPPDTDAEATLPFRGEGGPERQTKLTDAAEVEAHPRSSHVLTEETALRPADDAPHPAERGDASAYAFARFDEEQGEDATQIDPRSEIAEMPTHVLASLPANPYLECVRGKDVGRVFTLQEGATSVGRALDNDIILQDVSVSRKHFTLTWDERGITLRDLGSGNGVKVGERSVHEGPVVHGESILCGETTLTLHVPGAGGVPVRPEALARSAGSERPSRRVADAPTVTFDSAYRPRRELRAAFVAARAWASTRVGRAVLVGGAVGLLVALGLGLWLGEGGAGEAEAAEAYELGVAAFERGDWTAARRAFDAARAMAPEHEGARLGAERAVRALADEAILRAARVHLAAGRPEEAASELSALSAETMLVGERARVLEEIRAAREAQREAKPAGRATKRSPVPAAERPTRPRPSTSPTPTTRPTTRPTPKPTAEPPAREPERFKDPAPPAGGAARKQALALYAKEDFMGAADLLRQAAGRASGADADELDTLATRIDAFSRAYANRDAADTGRRIEALRAAVLADRAISGGVFAKGLEGTLLAAYLAVAEKYKDQGNAVQACTTVRQAANVRASDPRVRAAVASCEGEARDLLEEAAAARGSDAARARDLYRRVMLMVPSASPVHAEARKRLSALGTGASRDDDE